MEMVTSINYLAVFVCGVLAMAVGSLWYSPFVFGKMWMEEVDKSDEEIKRNLNPVKLYGLSFVGHLVMAYVLARVMVYINATTAIEGARIAFLCWLGFTAATMMINALYEGKSIRLVLVDGGYHLIVLLAYGTLLGAWQ
jgi:hypothetical protein